MGEGFSPVTIRGKASDNKGVRTVRLSLKRGDNNKYFNGTTWQKKPVWLKAKLGSAGATSTSWKATFTLPKVRISVEAQSVDTSVNISTTATSSFQMMAPPDLKVQDIATWPATWSQGFEDAYTAITVWNVGQAAYSRTQKVTVTVPESITVTSTDDGNGWSCTTTAHTATCRTSASVPGGGATLPLNVYYDIAVDAPASVSITATITASGQITPSNDTKSIDVPVTQLP